MKSWPTRAITADGPFTISTNWKFVLTSANPIAGANHGLIKRQNAMRCMRIDVGSAAAAGNGSFVDEENCWSDRAHIYTRRARSAAHTCAGTTTCSSGCSCTPAFNLGLWMRTLFGVGTPRALQGRAIAVGVLLSTLRSLVYEAIAAIWDHRVSPRPTRTLAEHLVTYS